MSVQLRQIHRDGKEVSDSLGWGGVGGTGGSHRVWEWCEWRFLCRVGMDQKPLKLDVEQPWIYQKMQS